MKYSLTLASLASLAVGSSALVHGHKNAHEHLHERGWQDVDFHTVHITYSQGQTYGSSTAPAPPAATTATQPTAAVPHPVQSSAQAAPSQQAPASSQAAAAPSSYGGGSASSGASSGSVIKSLQSKGMKPASNDNTQASLSPGLPNKNTVINKSGQTVAYTCWGPKGSWVNDKVALLSFELQQDESQDVYFYNTPQDVEGGACAVANSNTPMVNGQISGTWIEHTYTADAGSSTIDVSKEVNASGMVVHIKTDCGCESTNDPSGQKCVYQCANGEQTCTYGYSIFDPAKQDTCHGAGTQDGGCTVGSGRSATITIMG